MMLELCQQVTLKKPAANLLSLLVWFEVVGRMHEHQIHGHYDRDQAKDGRQEESEAMDSDAMPERVLID